MATFNGGSGADNFVGTIDADQANGNAGNDTLNGAGGNDTLDGGADQDILVGGEGSDSLSGGDNRDILYSHAVDPDFGGYHQEAAVSYDIYAEVDTLFGGAGDDALFAGYGDSADGGGGSFIHDKLYISFRGAPGGVTADFRGLSGGGSVTIGGGTYTGIEDVVYIEGTDFDDMLAAWSASASFARTAGLAIHGHGGNDTIYTSISSGFGGGGSDTHNIYGGDGDDYINDTASVSGSVVFGEAGDDRIIGGGGGGNFSGGDDDDLLEGHGWLDRLSGDAGNDFLDGGGNRDTLFGGEGNDSLHGAGDEDTLEGGGGDDTLYGDFSLISSANERVGATNDDILRGGAGVDTLYGNQGNDTLDGGTEADTMAGGTGNDIYYVDDAGDVVVENEGEGTDEVRTAFASYTLAGVHIENLSATNDSAHDFRGNAAGNVITGGAGDDALHGEQGNDTLVGGAGADSMAGGIGDDIYHVDNAGDVIVENEGEGTDEIRTAFATYSLVGTQIEKLSATDNATHDFRGSAADNVLTGGGGDDLLRLQDGGADSALGGGGNDVLYFGAAFTGADIADGGLGRDVLILQGNYSLTLSATNVVGVESLSLQSGARTTWGDTANNFYDYVITMNDGNATGGQQLIVNGQSLRVGEDFTFDGSAESGDGKYLVYGGHGVDDLTGGAGADVFFFEGTRFGPDDRIDGGAGRDALIISSGSGLNRIEFGEDSLTSIESISLNARYATDPTQLPSYELILSNGNVAPGATLIVNGSSLSNPVQTVTVDGTAVHDGQLHLLGGFGDDLLIGGDGADIFEGRQGADELIGGAGADTFRYTVGSHSGRTAPDEILDFVSGTDKIDLSAIDAHIFAAGNQAFRWIGANAFGGTGAASAGELRAYEHEGDWFVEGDMDGNGVADLVIQLTTPAAPPVQGDFLL